MRRLDVYGHDLPRRPYGVLDGSTATSPPRASAADPVQTGEADDDPRLRRMRAEAVLLLAKSPLSARKLAQLADLADATEARTLVRRLNQLYDELGRALRIEQIAGGYRLMTRAAVAPWLAKLGHLPTAVRLSTPMMETLAVVAYRQPVSRASTEAVRGVACGEILRQLMERDLIRIAGRSEELGRPYLYGTTKRFLKLFGLPNADALPPIQWQALQDDHEQSSADEDRPQSTSQDSPTDEWSTSPKESVVSIAVAPAPAEADPEVLALSSGHGPEAAVLGKDLAPRAVDDDDDEEEWEDGDDEDDDEEYDEGVDDDWEDGDDLDEDEDDIDEEEIDDLDDDEDDDWQEVDDEDDDEDDEDDDWDDEEDDDDEEEWAEDDEDWE